MISKEDCVFFELCPFQILKYLIIHWRCETAGVSIGALLDGQLVISIEALNSKHQANTLHCVTTSKWRKKKYSFSICFVMIYVRVYLKYSVITFYHVITSRLFHSLKT